MSAETSKVDRPWVALYPTAVQSILVHSIALLVVSSVHRLAEKENTCPRHRQGQPILLSPSWQLVFQSAPIWVSCGPWVLGSVVRSCDTGTQLPHGGQGEDKVGTRSAASTQGKAGAL